VAVARGIDLCSPIDGLTVSGILARSLEYLPKDVVRDGLPHFGAMRDDWKGAPRPHQGLDIYVDHLTVLAMAAGKVVGAGWGDRAGGWVKIDHGSGVDTVYVHLRTVAVKRGDAVQQGQLIGTIDGPQGNAIEAQLHLEIRLDGTPVDPVPLFMAASPPELQQAWQRAIQAEPERVEQRRRELAHWQAENTD
jgi:murein DD-endopeptidase MepM/ murein hydrolase activator NlpD